MTISIRYSALLLVLLMTDRPLAFGQSVVHGKAQFLALLDAPETVNFDSLPSHTTLSGNEFESVGVIIRNLANHPINVVAWTAHPDPNLTIPSAPNAISSSMTSNSAGQMLFDNSRADSFRFEFTTPARAVGIHLGQNDLRGVTVSWFTFDNVLVHRAVFDPFAPANDFVGFVTDVPLVAMEVANAANDGDGMFYDDLVFEPACVVTPPVISNTAADKTFLWPPDHRLVNVGLAYGVTGSCGLQTSCTLEVVSSEPDNGLGDGDMPNDIAINGPFALALRAERAGFGTGRIYTVKIACEDTAGNEAFQQVTVAVPHSINQRVR